MSNPGACSADNSIGTVELQSLANRLIDWFDHEQAYVVALSGGVDSAVVAQAAKLSGCSCTALTADGPSLAERERDDAIRMARIIDIPHQFLKTHEIDDPNYAQNDRQRCFHCKATLFAAIRHSLPTHTILTGTNADDLGDYRPGLKAAAIARVKAPLAELRIAKRTVRRLATLWGLPIADKPASPCLASRLAYGVPVTSKRLTMVEKAESRLRELDLADCRVRLHEGELARIEVPNETISRLAEPLIRETLVQDLKALGFNYVALDLEGLRSGSLNRLVQIEDNISL